MGGLTSLALSAPAYAIDGPDLDSIQAPCSTPASNKGQKCNIGLRSCERMRRSLASATSFVDKQPGVLDNLDKLIDTKIKYYYRGLDVDLYNTSDAVNPEGTPYPPPLCNVLENEIDKPDPNPNRHPSIVNTCGDYSVLGPTTFINANGKGDRERAYKRGGFIQALKCFKAQVSQEIETQNGLNTQHCSFAARDIANSIQIAKTQSNQLSGLCSAVETGATDFCTEEWTNSSNSEAIRHRQAACHLQSARQNLESAFARTAYCEVVSRARASWESNADKVSDLLKTQGTDPCLAWAQNGQCKEIRFIGGIIPIPIRFTNPDCVTRQFNKCYQGQTQLPGYPGAMKQVLEKFYPDSGKCQSKADPLPGTGFGFMLGTLGLIRRKKKKSKSITNERGDVISTMAAIFPLSIFGLMFLANVIAGFLCSAFGWFCPDPPQIVAYCHDPSFPSHDERIATKEQAQKCCTGRNLDQDPPSPLPTCDLRRVASSDVPGSVEGINNDVARAGDGLRVAAALLSNQGEMSTDQPNLAQMAPAIGATGVPPAGARTKTSAATDSILPFRTTQKSSGGGGGGMASGGDASLGDVSTKDSASGEMIAFAPKTDPQGYQSAAKGGASAARSKASFDDSLGRVSPEKAGGDEDEDSVLGAAGGDIIGKEKSLSIEDPADYFTRIGMEENLFKRVEKRYQSKATNWALTAIRALKAAKK